MSSVTLTRVKKRGRKSKMPFVLIMAAFEIHLRKLGEPKRKFTKFKARIKNVL